MKPPRVTVLEGGLDRRQETPLEAAYGHFRLERQGNLVSDATLRHYDHMVLPFLAWSLGAGRGGSRT